MDGPQALIALLGSCPPDSLGEPRKGEVPGTEGVAFLLSNAYSQRHLVEGAMQPHGWAAPGQRGPPQLPQDGLRPR